MNQRIAAAATFCHLLFLGLVYAFLKCAFLIVKAIAGSASQDSFNPPIFLISLGITIIVFAIAARNVRIMKAKGASFIPSRFRASPRGDDWF